MRSLAPGEYDVFLVVDTREQSAFHRDKGVIQVEGLISLGLLIYYNLKKSPVIFIVIFMHGG